MLAWAEARLPGLVLLLDEQDQITATRPMTDATPAGLAGSAKWYRPAGQALLMLSGSCAMHSTK